MPRIFISHSHHDRETAHTFRELIEALGYEVWLDAKSIPLSQEWKPALVSGLEGSDWLLVLISQDSVRSDWVPREVSWAIEHLPARVIPMVLDEASPTQLDVRLAEMQHGDYHKNKQQCINKLIKILSDARYAGYGIDIIGDWKSAVQPVYYDEEGWHVQDVKISASAEFYIVKTVAELGKLQWRLDAKLFTNAFLAGPWQSTRMGSRSQGFMTLQLARNGTYMCGHDYAIAFGDAKAHFGIMLLAKTEPNLQLAWEAVKSSQRELHSLNRRVNF